MGTQPYAYLAIMLVVIGLFIGTYVKGRVDGRDVCQSRIAGLQTTSTTSALNEQNKAVEASTTLENHRATTQVKYRTITKTVEKVIDRPVYRAECFDTDGVRLSNAALTGEATAPGEPGSPLPAATAVE